MRERGWLLWRDGLQSPGGLTLNSIGTPMFLTEKESGASEDIGVLRLVTEILEESSKQPAENPKQRHECWSKEEAMNSCVWESGSSFGMEQYLSRVIKFRQCQ